MNHVVKILNDLFELNFLRKTRRHKLKLKLNKKLFHHVILLFHIIIHFQDLEN